MLVISTLIFILFYCNMCLSCVRLVLSFIYVFVLIESVFQCLIGILKIETSVFETTYNALITGTTIMVMGIYFSSQNRDYIFHC